MLLITFVTAAGAILYVVSHITIVNSILLKCRALTYIYIGYEESLTRGTLDMVDTF